MNRVNLISYGARHRKIGSVHANFDFPCFELYNPHSGLKPENRTGEDRTLQSHIFFKSGDKAYDMLDAATTLIQSSDLDEITVAFHCIGGKHRSVTMVERTADWLLENTEATVSINHMDIR